MIARWPLCRGTPSWRSSSISSPTCSSWRGPSRSASSRTAAPRRGCARRRARSRSSRSTAARRSCRGSARRSRRRSCRSSRRRDRGARQGRPRPARGRPVHAAARSRAEDRGPDLAGARRHDARRAEGAPPRRSSCGRSPGSGRRARRRSSQALAFKAENPDEGRRLLGDGLPAVQAVVAVLREHPAAVAVSEAGSVRRRKETFRDLDIIATATDPAELTGYFTQLKWVVDVAAHGDTKATVVSNDGLRFDLRVVPPESFGNLLQHFTGSKDHNVAMREDAVRRGLSISEYGVTTVETGDVFKSEDEDARLRVPRLPADPAGAAGERRRARGGAARRAAEARRAARRARRHAHAHALVGRRQEHARGDGRGGGRARLRVLRDHRPLALHARREAARSSSRRSTRCARGSRSCASSRASRRTSARTARSTWRRRSWRCSTGSSRPSTRPPRTGRPSACSRRWRTRTSTASATSQAGGSGRGRPRDVDVERVIEKALEVGTLPRDQRTAGPARPARRACAGREGGRAEARRLTPTRTRSRAQTYVELGRRAGAPRLADEGRRRQHADVEADREAAEEAAVTTFARTAPPRSSGRRAISSGSASCRCSRR